MQTTHIGCMGPRPQSGRWEIGGVLFDEAWRVVPQKPSAFRKPVPPLPIPDRNYYQEYLSRKARAEPKALSIGPIAFNFFEALQERLTEIYAQGDMNYWREGHWHDFSVEQISSDHGDLPREPTPRNRSARRAQAKVTRPS